MVHIWVDCKDSLKDAGYASGAMKKCSLTAELEILRDVVSHHLAGTADVTTGTMCVDSYNEAFIT
jgi:hypothetical protein